MYFIKIQFTFTSDQDKEEQWKLKSHHETKIKMSLLA